jgi:hypothetical protein
MVRRGEVKGYVELARRHGLSRARVTQIASLTLLSPSLQEALLLDERGAQPFVAPKPLWERHGPDR